MSLPRLARESRLAEPFDFAQGRLWATSQRMQRSKDESKEVGLTAPVPTFAKNAKVGHPPNRQFTHRSGLDYRAVDGQTFRNPVR